MIIKLKNSYPSIYKLPVIHSVDTDIFNINYFSHCMSCNFCNDQCCSYGADVDMLHVKNILKHKTGLEKFTGIKSEDWFYTKKIKWDHEYPGNYYTRIRKKNNACVFLNRTGRGCMIHSYSLQKGLDYHEMKPFFCTIFPLTFNEGVLVTPEEIDEKITACLGPGPTLYEGARKELIYYFGMDMIREIDVIEMEHLKHKKRVKLNKA